MIICAGEIEQFDFAKSVGIGMIEVAINLTQLVLKNKPNSLLFIGSAGSYGKKEIFEIFESSDATNIENSLFNSNAYSPIKNNAKPLVITGLEAVPRGTFVNSSNYITRDKNLGKFYLKKGIEIENMEYYAVVKVAKKFNISVNGIFIITNYCDSNAHEDFIKNHKKAMKKLTNYIIKQNILK